MRRLLPPALFAILLGLVGALALSRPRLGGAIVPEGRLMAVAVVLGVAGLVLLGGARVQFARRDCEIMTFASPRNLVTTGLFAVSRNPMYLGFSLLLLAAALAANSLPPSSRRSPSSSPRTCGTSRPRSVPHARLSDGPTTPTPRGRAVGCDGRAPHRVSCRPKPLVQCGRSSLLCPTGTPRSA